MKNKIIIPDVITFLAEESFIFLRKEKVFTIEAAFLIYDSEYTNNIKGLRDELLDEGFVGRFLWRIGE